MPKQHFIAADTFCLNHQIDYHFIQLLRQSGLIKTLEESETLYIPEEQLPALERMVRLHFEMDINLEGIETINYLLQRMEAMQQEIVQLKNRIGFYET